jgi:DNA-binding IclR family transcriptional regulator
MILRALSDAPPGGLRAVDVAHAIGLGRATSHRLLLGLASQGIVEHDPKSARFSVSRLAVKWGLAALNRHGLAEAGLHPVRKLSEMTGDTAYLAIRSIDHAECVDYAEGSFPIKALTMQVGDKTTLVEGAFGLAILAQLQDQEIETLVQHSTRNSPSFDHAGLWADISQTRQSGIAIKETATGITSMAAPIRGRTGDVLGAIGLSAISTRFAEGRRDRLVPLLRDAAAKIEQAILDHQT